MDYAINSGNKDLEIFLDLHLEIGGVDNTIEELHRTTEALADVLSDYYWHREK